MDMMQAIKERHSVRTFTDKQIDGEVSNLLVQEIEKCNRESGLHMQLCLNEPEAFQASKPHYGSFKNCRNYIAIVGALNSDELCGYYGEKIVLYAKTLGLNTCWVALTYKKKKAHYTCENNEKLKIVIALGYGDHQGVPHKSKDISKLYEAKGKAPQWFINGVEAASLAPTAVNQQKFKFIVDGNIVCAKTKTSLIGQTKMDLGIVKYHFEQGAGVDNFKWSSS